MEDLRLWSGIFRFFEKNYVPKQRTYLSRDGWTREVFSGFGNRFLIDWLIDWLIELLFYFKGFERWSLAMRQESKLLIVSFVLQDAASYYTNEMSDSHAVRRLLEITKPSNIQLLRTTNSSPSIRIHVKVFAFTSSWLNSWMQKLSTSRCRKWWRLIRPTKLRVDILSLDFRLTQKDVSLCQLRI